MENNAQISWSDTLTKFSSYKGTVVAFCIENNIKVHQLYYQRKKAVRDNQPVFHGIKVNKNEIPNPEVQPSDAKHPRSRYNIFGLRYHRPKKKYRWT